MKMCHHFMFMKAMDDVYVVQYCSIVLYVVGVSMLFQHMHSV